MVVLAHWIRSWIGRNVRESKSVESVGENSRKEALQVLEQRF